MREFTQNQKNILAGLGSAIAAAAAILVIVVARNSSSPVEVQVEPEPETPIVDDREETVDEQQDANPATPSTVELPETGIPASDDSTPNGSYAPDPDPAPTPAPRPKPMPTPPKNNDPVIEELIVTSDGMTLTVAGNATDPDVDPLNLYLSIEDAVTRVLLTDGGKDVDSGEALEFEFARILDLADVGSLDVVVKVSVGDSRGGTALVERQHRVDKITTVTLSEEISQQRNGSFDLEVRTALAGRIRGDKEVNIYEAGGTHNAVGDYALVLDGGRTGCGGEIRYSISAEER